MKSYFYALVQSDSVIQHL